LSVLVDSALKAGLVPARYPDWKVHAFRKVRNALAHGRASSRGMWWQEALLKLADLINAVYDPSARLNYPPAFVGSRLESDQMERMWKGIATIPPGRPQPGDHIAIVGADDQYPAGTYECYSCGRKATRKSRSPQLAVCRRCRGTAFRFLPRAADDQPASSDEGVA
jgi:hypothetical protein